MGNKLKAKHFKECAKVICIYCAGKEWYDETPTLSYKMCNGQPTSVFVDWYHHSNHKDWSDALCECPSVWNHITGRSNKLVVVRQDEILG